MKLLFSSLFIMLACGLVLSCCKNAETPGPAEEQLPPITSTGAGTFGCKVNGKVWVAKSNKTGWPPTYASINKQVHNETNISGSIINGNTDFGELPRWDPYKFLCISLFIPTCSVYWGLRMKF